MNEQSTIGVGSTGKSSLRILSIAVGAVLVIISTVVGRHFWKLHQRSECVSRLSQAAKAMVMYSMDSSEDLPKAFKDITNYVVNPVQYVCPCSGHEPLALTNVDEWSDFILIGGLRASDPLETIVAICPPQNHGGEGAHVLHMDGSVEWMEKKDFDAAIGNLDKCFGVTNHKDITNRLLELNIDIPTRLGIKLESMFPAVVAAKAAFERMSVAEQVRMIVSCRYDSRLVQVVLKQGDAAVPALAELLSNNGKEAAEEAVRILADMNTQASRQALIRAYEHKEGDLDIKWVVYWLAKHPHRDVEPVFIDVITQTNATDNAVVWAASALGSLGSKRAIPALQERFKGARNWYEYYATLVALRKIRDVGLPEEVEGALNKISDIGTDEEHSRLDRERAEAVLRTNIDSVLPDLVDMAIRRQGRKGGWPLPNKVTVMGLLKNAGGRVTPYLKIAARDCSFHWDLEFITNLAHDLSITLDLDTP